MFSLNGTLKKSGSVGRWETKQFIGMAIIFPSTSKSKYNARGWLLLSRTIGENIITYLLSCIIIILTVLIVVYLDQKTFRPASFSMLLLSCAICGNVIINRYNSFIHVARLPRLLGKGGRAFKMAKRRESL